jgi:hypothetical protein
MPKRSPEDVLEDIEDSDLDDAAERAEAMTSEERRRKLEAAGYTEGELSEKAARMYAKLQSASAMPLASR